MNKFICVHLGARSHYYIPVAMELQGKLAMLVTDTWLTSASIRKFLAKLPLRNMKSLSNRHSKEINSKRVSSFNFQFILIELYIRLVYKKGWGQILYRNSKFQKAALKALKNTEEADTLFGTSYTSLAVFRKAKEKGQRTILFQIDPGFEEEKIVSRVVKKHTHEWPTNWEKAPEQYWSDWMMECELADCIMVNSDWSRTNLIKYGVPASKLKVVPLPYAVENKHLSFIKEVPIEFNRNRPLQCLFLGTLTLRKGIHIVLDAARQLINYPVEFILVGQSELPEFAYTLDNVKYKGIATRQETEHFYQQADVFLFPTLSDGFGLTQLEAMAWQVPVIASTNCGRVVEHEVNGLIMTSCSSDILMECILFILNNPADLKRMIGNCLPTVSSFNINRFSKELSDLL